LPKYWIHLDNPMPLAFHNSIQKALADRQLQNALDRHSRRHRDARPLVLASLPEDLPVMRQRAHRMRAEVIANLDGYLEQFIRAVQANGVIVHRAADAAQAVEIIRKIASQQHARVIAKSKSMVSEEIFLNQALEADGLQVVETDLGEYIIQLRGERPSHIVAPSIHLNRDEVAETFHHKLGMPITNDIPTLTAAARQALRQVFLSADIGISGVNMGVVESGTLCIITNEGNARMVTSLPPVHIALMGIERLVPTLDDLALVLSLLPRSATEQKITVYTSLIHAPSNLPGINPVERHLVLLDNGREAMRRSPLEEALYCIRCGACLNICPVFRAIGGHAYVDRNGQSSTYTGPIGSVISPGLLGYAEFGHLARASSLCGACKEVCPVDIDLPRLLLRVRAGSLPVEPAGLTAGPPRPQPNVPTALAWGLRFFTWMAARPRIYSGLQRTAGKFSRLLPASSGWMRLPAFTGWGLSKNFPRPAARPFRDRFTGSASHAPQPPVETPASRPPADHPADLPALSHPLQPARLPDAHLVERFEAEFTALGGIFTRCRQTELPTLLLDALRQRGIDAIQSWDSEHLPPGLVNFLHENGVSLTVTPDPGLHAGLTGVLAAAAETGTLALALAPGRPLTASLLPEVHLAVLRAGDIYADFGSLLKLPQVRQASSAVLISGPSRTADIEMTLTVGVHGPGNVMVYCLVD
jgi:L-lactate dehydrogenase complex protein LldF